MKVDYRRKPRKDCKIPATIRSGAGECKAYLVDLTELGVRLVIENKVRTIAEGDEIEIHTQELGLLKGRARWRSSHRIGIELHENAETIARVGAFFKSSDALSSEDRNIADELAHAADQPDGFTKDEMAGLMKLAAEKIRRDQKMLASIKAKLVDAFSEGRHGSAPASLTPLRGEHDLSLPRERPLSQADVDEGLASMAAGVADRLRSVA